MPVQGQLLIGLLTEKKKGGTLRHRPSSSQRGSRT